MSHAEVAAGVTCLAATAVGVGAIVVLHVLPTGLSPMRNAVSQYGITRYRLGYRVQTIALAVAGGAAAVGLAEAAPGRARAVIALVIIFALARLVISWFPMDEPGGERTNHGVMHGLIAIVTFLAIAIAAARLGTVAKQVPGWTTLATVSSVIAWLMAASLVAMMVVRRGARATHSTPNYFGAIERVFYLAIVAWLVLVGVGLM
ncbi:MAG TPA: DUF998 domain-containing protein [Acidothermaceae bacterium]|nr:DUF998 domain-containing protein [Acidothermaceae bacterium]